jgi:hypothetical protein
MTISKRTLDRIKLILEQENDHQEKELLQLATAYTDLKESVLEWITFWMEHADTALKSTDHSDWRNILSSISGSMKGSIDELSKDIKDLTHETDSMLKYQNVLPDESNGDNTKDGTR